MRVVAALFWLVSAASAQADALALQPLIDATPVGGTLTLDARIYAGPAVIARTITLDGAGKATVDGGGSGTVITVAADGASVRNLAIIHSGTSHEDVDSAIRITGRNVVIKDTDIHDCLFGIDLKQTSHNILRRNKISSLTENELGQKGESIRLWYSDDNLIEDNRISGVRDTVVWYSRNNRLIGNRIEGSRYGIHFMYAHDNTAENNTLIDNTVGIFLMYSNDIRLTGNRIHYSSGPSGIALGFKESSGAIVENNDFFANAVGFYLDASPYDPDLENIFRGNRIAFNGTSVLLHSDWAGNRFEGNDFVGNHLEIAVDGGGTAQKNVWSGNYWDDYEGFDRDRSGIGDTPFEVWAWSDRLWMDVPDAKFFRASPALEALDFVERLAPLSEPRLLARDDKPRMAPVNAVAGGQTAKKE